MVIFRNHEGKDMKKFFTSVLFVSLFLLPNILHASVKNAAEAASAPAIIPPKDRTKELEKLYKEIPDLHNPEAVRQYLKKRLSITSVANISPEDIFTPSATSIVDEKGQQKQQATISAYEKIYQESMKKAATQNTLNEDVEIDGTFYRLKETPHPTESFVPDFPFVTIKLSDNREILAPAEEHIAYMLTSIKIEPTGLLNVTEEFVFVSNNETFPVGFFRILPKYSYSQDGQKRRLDLTLEKVTINDKEYPYKITEIGNYLHIEPQTPLDLPTGIHTYRFSYLIDRAVWLYDDYDELIWNITGRTIPNVIGSTNAVVVLPTGKTFLSQDAFATTKEGINPERVTITTIAENALGFADTEALAMGNDIHLLVRFEKGMIVAPDFAKKYTWFIHDHGAVLFAFLALMAIFISYKISSTQLRRNQDKTRVTLRKTPSMYRLINKTVFDKHSFGAEILNLCAKDVLELSAKEHGAVLFKKTDNLSKLTKFEQKLIKHLFPNTETSLEIAPEAGLKLKRAYNFLKTNTLRRFELYKLQLNGLYLLFSISMLLCGIIGAAAVSINPWHSFWIITGCTVLISISQVLLSHKFRNKYLNFFIKLFLISEILTIGGWMAIYTSNLYAVFIILSIGAIISYHRLFSRRNGLLRNKIKETEDYKSYLQKNIEFTQTGKDFNTKIPYIFAFELEGKYQGVDSFSLINCLLQQL